MLLECLVKKLVYFENLTHSEAREQPTSVGTKVDQSALESC